MTLVFFAVFTVIPIIWRFIRWTSQTAFGWTFAPEGKPEQPCWKKYVQNWEKITGPFENQIKM
jgi:hypothetical protein